MSAIYSPRLSRRVSLFPRQAIYTIKLYHHANQKGESRNDQAIRTQRRGAMKKTGAAKKVSSKQSGPLKGQNHGVRVGDAVLKERTGKTWDEWFPILDKAGASKMNHTRILTFLMEKFKVPGWWSQMVAVGYEHSRGLREIYESCGGFSANISRTFEVAVKPLFAACQHEKQRGAWLADDKLVVSTVQPGKTVRGAWDGGSRLEIRFYPKGAAKTQVVIDHMKLSSGEQVEKMKAYWAKNLERLKEFAGG
jgi:hypothetical protein